MYVEWSGCEVWTEKMKRGDREEFGVLERERGVGGGGLRERERKGVGDWYRLLGCFYFPSTFILFVLQTVSVGKFSGNEEAGLYLFPDFPLSPKLKSIFN